jgi:hypothetical protein
VTTPPRHYFLNEAHELAHAERKGGGQPPKFGEIDWAEKGRVIAKSLTSARAHLLKSPDPTARERLYILATPVDAIPKVGMKKGVPIQKTEKPTFRGADSLRLKRLGLDLVGVASSGAAVVHAKTEAVDRLLGTAAALGREGAREQARWAALSRFDVVPASMKVDESWLATIAAGEVVECMVRLQPMLSRLDVERVARAIVDTTRLPNERILRVGRTISGRPWFLASLHRRTIEAIATQFPSVQALHEPLTTLVDGTAKRSSGRLSAAASLPPNANQLPLVGIVDGGIPTNHAELRHYIRGHQTGRNSGSASAHDHGSWVASRAVFGDVDFYAGLEATPHGDVAVLDIAVADLSRTVAEDVHVADEDVIDAMRAAIAGNPSRASQLVNSMKP